MLSRYAPSPYTLPGAWVAVALGCLSFTPSLLPRSPLAQGALLGVNAAIGYGLGVLAAWVWRAFADRDPRPARPWAWPVFRWLAPALLLLSLVLGAVWQARLRDLMGVPRGNAVAVLLVPAVGVLLFVGLVALGRLLRRAYRWTARVLARHMGRRAADAVGLVLVVAATWLVVSGLLLDGLMGAADRSFALADTGTNTGTEQPGSGLRSGSPPSLVPWDSLGRRGRDFTARGPTAAQISDVTGRPATEPVRVYAGTASAAEVEDRARLAVDDLVRAGGFDRGNLLVATTTGSGWLDPAGVAAFEHLLDGDTAIVTMQYSHLPSWVSYLTDQERAQDAGRQLFDAVYEQWLAMPGQDRPRLFAFGESLGSFGAEAAFSGEHDLANRLSGALFTGPPSFNPLYRQFTDDREPGTPEREPVYRAGRTIRFSNDVGAGAPPLGEPWDGSRVLYLQHPSDPIVWWSTDLLVQRPDWLTEPRGRDVLDAVGWIPLVTFWQLSADLPPATALPPGHGHRYSTEYVDGWATVLQVDGWPDADRDRLRDVLVGSED